MSLKTKPPGRLHGDSGRIHEVAAVRPERRESALRQPSGTHRTNRPTVFIVDDNPAMCKSLSWLIETLDVEVKTYQSAATFLDQYDSSEHGCLLLDLRLPEMSGLDLQQKLVERGVTTPVIILTGHADVQTAVTAIKNGAVEFLEKPVDDEVLIEHIQRALAVDACRRGDGNAHRLVRERIQRLTLREDETLGLVVEGLPSKQIAARLGVTKKTVEAHRANIMKKMEAKCVAELVRMVVAVKRPLHGAHR